jgi:hypothetical protein
LQTCSIEIKAGTINIYAGFIIGSAEIGGEIVVYRGRKTALFCFIIALFYLIIALFNFKTAQFYFVLRQFYSIIGQFCIMIGQLQAN